MSDSRTLRWNKCPLCRSERRSILVDHGSLAFARCECGLVYKSCGEAKLVEETEPTWNKRYDKRQARRVRKARWQIQDVLNHVEPGPLLDVGCSLGYALEAAAELGLDAKGLDLNEALIEPCRERGHDVYVGDVAGPYPFPDESFNLVLLKHVFEHTPEPRAALRELRRVVKPGGAIFIAVPNVEYFKARLAPKSYYYFSPDSGGRYHFVYYTSKHLRRLVDDEGFRTVRVHPHLWHRRVGWRTRLTDLGLLPCRALDGRFRNAIGLAREFWLIAVKNCNPASA
ncbi:MAG: class I SAM-dependent methyltransferase [Thermoanaerobaculia bacterium]